jgi:hypothetical protein
MSSSRSCHIIASDIAVINWWSYFKGTYSECTKRKKRIKSDFIYYIIMESKQKRFKEFGTSLKNKIGPGQYDTGQYQGRESFNFGAVPFGSQSNLQAFQG